MSLRALAEADLQNILEDQATGFGYGITIINPNEDPLTMKGYTQDISQTIDTDTGQIVSGRLASVSLRESTLIQNNFSMPVGVVDQSLKPWIIKFNDINGAAYTFKIVEANPDRTLGVITCLLEEYQG